MIITSTQDFKLQQASKDAQTETSSPGRINTACLASPESPATP
ncbi:hypothetical protein [Cardiobacterium valvarum]|uniref:Uncharacterized protein n=1 Tax=Cardiobacterium valvarum F0432 TaxID=797473 RepID=G9ZCD3_9GAMM|nr:hypothetical protein [Cardiobacterium valvarum]EHM55748.1 hypothetical protein HMPREF9080_00410 [Cardiobacterium valvarum F0432]